jgi:DNA polymerase III epsilon subunit-like protein
MNLFRLLRRKIDKDKGASTSDKVFMRKGFRHRDLCFIDIETTGATLGMHEIIDIAVIRTDPTGETLQQTWHKLIQPKHPELMSPEASKINGFSPQRWAYADESSSALWREFASVVRNSVAVCQNPSFDRGFISLAAGAYGIQHLDVDYHWIGIESLAWPLYGFKEIPNLRLESICERFGLPPEPMPHTALNGAKKCREAYKALMVYYAQSELHQSSMA